MRLAVKVISWIVIEELVRELLRDCGDIAVEKSCGDLRRSLETFVVLFSAFAEDFEVIVIVNKSQDDAEQHQEHADLRYGPEISTLEPPVRIDPGESVMV